MWTLVCLVLIVGVVSTEQVDLKEVCKNYSQAVYTSNPVAKDGGDLTKDACPITETLNTAIKDAEPREFAHMALIGNHYNWLCTGILISERYVLSTAHCSRASGRFTAPPELARLGDYNSETTEDENQGRSQPQDYPIEKTINHPDYDPFKYYNDIVLYKLKTDVVFNEFIRPICLHTELQLPESSAIYAGWDLYNRRGGASKNDNLEKMKVAITSYEDCKYDYRQPGVTDDAVICTKSDVEEDLCQASPGDSLQIRRNDTYCMYSLIGVFSYRETCGTRHSIFKDPSRAGKTPVFMRLSHYVPWIQSIVWG